MILLCLLLCLLLSACCGPAASVPPPVKPEPPCCSSPLPSPGASPGIGADRELAAVFSDAGVDPRKLKCSTFVSWEPTLNRYAKAVVTGLARQWSVTPDAASLKRARHHVLGYLVRSYFNQAQPHNLGAVVLKGHTFTDAQGKERPLLVIRSAVTIGAPRQQACFESLIRHAGVRYVVNLYGGTFPFHDVIEAEKKAALRLGVTYYDLAKHPQLKFRALIEEPDDYKKNIAQAEKNLATLINTRLLRPGGKPPRGNLYFHCCGGMHRSGMIFGVLQRCINGVPMSEIEQQYRRHVAYTDDQRPGGFEPLNLRFIRQFDCKRITP